VLKPPYSFTEEYQSISSETNPSRTFRSIADYQKSIAPDTSLYAKIYYTATTRQGIINSSDDTFGTDARLQKHVPRKNLNLSLGVSYAQRRSITISETYTVNSSLMWRIGKLTLTASASVSESVSTTPAGGTATANEQYFLTISRRLF
jgi:hypothetical protein